MQMQHQQGQSEHQQDSPSLKATAREFNPKFAHDEAMAHGYYDAMGMDVGMGVDMETMMTLAMQQYGVPDVSVLESMALNMGMTLPAFLQANYMAAAAQYGVYNTGGYETGYAAYGVVDPNMSHYMQPDGSVQYVDPSSYYSLDTDVYLQQQQAQPQQQQPPPNERFNH
jgi:hypothetical protein